MCAGAILFGRSLFDFADMLVVITLMTSIQFKGPAFTLDPIIPESDLTPDLLKKDNWKTTAFKKFNLDAAPVRTERC